MAEFDSCHHGRLTARFGPEHRAAPDERLPGPADRERPRRALLFVTCLVDLLHPDVGEAAATLLERYGVAVEFPEGQTCCGQPAFNSGFDGDARALGRSLLAAFPPSDPVVTPSGSCAAMVRSHFPALFRGTPEEERARDLASRTYELSEFMVDVLRLPGGGGRWEGSVTYHDSCHALRELGVRVQGRQLLSGIEGLELLEMGRPEACCGFGGTFSVRLPDVATAMADQKVGDIEATGADAVVAGDAGCLMHLAGRLSRSGRAVRAVHLATLLAEAQGLLHGRQEAP